MLPVGHTYVLLYATSDHETHFRMVQVQLDLVEDFAPPAQPLYIGDRRPSRRAFLLAFPPKWGESDLPQGIWHPTPAPQIATLLQGHIINYASDGTTHEMKPGDMMLMEDLAPAKGHITINVNADTPSVLQIIQLSI
jgi:hypothetical protein